jgi:tetratricopeptide (TPR) repeat protein
MLMRMRANRCGLAVLAVLLVVPMALAGPFDGDGPDQQGPEEQALRYMQENRHRAAIEVLKKAIIRAPNDARLHFRLGQAYRLVRKPDLAEAEFRTVLREDKDFVEARIELANLAMRKAAAAKTNTARIPHVRLAIEQIEAAVRTSPHDLKLYYSLASRHMDIAALDTASADKAYQAALKVLDDVAKKSPKEIRPHVARGQTRLRYAGILAKGEKFSELKGATATKVNRLLDEGEADFRAALAAKPETIGPLNQLARIQAARGDARKAVATLEAHATKVDKPILKATCYRWMGQHLVSAEDLAAAEEQFTKAIATAPKDLASHLLLANVQLRRKMVDAAAKTLRAALAVEKRFLNGYVELGVLELRRGNATLAADHFKNALDLAPAKAIVVSTGQKRIQEVLGDLYTLAAVQYGELLFKQGKSDDALVVYQRLGTRMPYSPVPEYRMGEICRRLGKPEEAKEHYQNALRRNPKFAQARAANAEMIAAEARFAANRKQRAAIYQRAVAEYDLALEVVPNNPALLDRSANLLVRLARSTTPTDRTALERALERQKKAVELAPDAELFQYRLAGIQHELGHTREAVDVVQSLIKEMEKRLKEKPDDAGALYQRGDLYATLHSWQPSRKAYKAALDDFAAAIEQNPDLLVAYRRCARLCDESGDYKTAAEWYEKLLAAAQGTQRITALPADRRRLALHAAANLAWLYCEHLNDLDKAEKHAKLAAEVNANLPALIDTIGWIHYKRGQNSQAIVQLNRAYKHAPQNATVGYHLAAALAKVPNRDRAKEVLQAVKPHVGDDKDLAKKIDALLRQLGG